MSRVSWDQYFIDIARQVATRATCDRKHVGAVLVKKKRIIATGYNGSPPGDPHCDDVGHLMENGHCVRTIHAEDNVYRYIIENGKDGADSTLYCTTYPCYNCISLVLTLEPRRIVYWEEYRPDPRVKEACERAGVVLERFVYPSG